MRTYRPLMEPYYFDSKKYDTYLDQLGIKYPNPPASGIRRPAPSKSASSTGG
jgi:aminobenzoyl-glutamate utilization protein B